ncbi:MAG: thioredoxin family protein [Bacteroidota bacterium]
MQHFIHFLSLLLFCTLTQTSFAQGIQFEKGDWEATKARATQVDKIIFAEFYTDWCAPCKKMARNVFAQPTVGELYNQHFINFKIDGDSQQGQQLKQRYGVTAYPSYVFIRGDGSPLFSEKGYIEEADFIALGEKVALLKTDTQLTELRQAYQSGERGKAFLVEFMELRRDWLKADNSALLNELITQLSEEELQSPEYIKVIADHCYRADTRAFDLMLAQQERIISEELLTLDPAYEEAHQKQKEQLEQIPASQLLEASPQQLRQKIIQQDYEKRMDEALNNSFSIATRNKDNALFEEILRKHLQLNQQLKRRRSQQRNDRLQLRYYRLTEQAEPYARVAETYLNTHVLSQPVKVAKDLDSLRQQALLFTDASLEDQLGVRQANKIRELRSQSRQLSIRNTARDLTEVAEQYYEFFDDEVQLLKAVAWVEEAILRYDEPLHYLTYARLINKLGDKALAIKLLERGLTLARGTAKDGDKVAVSPRVWRKDRKLLDRELKKLKADN